MKGARGEIGLIVEVVSPGERHTAWMRRVSQFLNHGVHEVWLLDEEARSVNIFPRGKGFDVIGEEEEGSSREVLDVLRCRVADLFEPMNRGRAEAAP